MTEFEQLERVAAAYTHKSLSEFVLGRALRAVDESIQEHETLMLNRADWEVFLDTLHTRQSKRQSQAGHR